jgi:hypothetical protein
MTNGPIKTLECCVCGESTKGRQWFNCDKGYGICEPCVAFVRGHGDTDEDIRSNYGVEGVHYGPFESPDTSALRRVLGDALNTATDNLRANPYEIGEC